MTRSRPAPGGGLVVNVPPERLVAWVNGFVVRNAGLRAVTATSTAVTLAAGDGTTAELAVPYGPMELAHREPVEAILDHLAQIGTLGLVLVRAGAYSVGTCRDRVVLASTTDRRYVQGRTAAGGSSQQRFARRRSNQRRESLAAAADATARVLGPRTGTLQGVVLAGDRGRSPWSWRTPGWRRSRRCPAGRFPTSPNLAAPCSPRSRRAVSTWESPSDPDRTPGPPAAS